MKYALLIYDTDDGWEKLSEAERDRAFGEYFAISELPGVYGGAQLQPAQTATTIRGDDGRRQVTKGPFAKSKEFLGGYYLLEAEGLEAALDVAGRIPATRMGGAVEIRPLVDT
jgi:hypothetical protein